MNDRGHQPRRSLIRWVLRVLYILTPACVGVPVVGIVQDRGWENTVGLIAAFVLLGWLLLLTADLVFRWRDFVFLVLGAPLSLGDLWTTPSGRARTLQEMAARGRRAAADRHGAHHHFRSQPDLAPRRQSLRPRHLLPVFARDDLPRCHPGSWHVCGEG